MRSEVTRNDRLLTAGCAAIAKFLMEDDSPLQKRRADRFPSHASSLKPIGSDTERSLVEDRMTPVDDRVRRVTELKQEIADLQVQLAAGIVQDSGAIREKIQKDRVLLSILTAVPKFLDQIGRVR